jgi:hypothetical protein
MAGKDRSNLMKILCLLQISTINPTLTVLGWNSVLYVVADDYFC